MVMCSDVKEMVFYFSLSVVCFICVIYFAADRAVYLCTGIYHHVLKHIGE